MEKKRKKKEKKKKKEQLAIYYKKLQILLKSNSHPDEFSKNSEIYTCHKLSLCFQGSAIHAPFLAQFARTHSWPVTLEP